jgi:hypothetical protein
MNPGLSLTHFLDFLVFDCLPEAIALRGGGMALIFEHCMVSGVF